MRRRYRYDVRHFKIEDDGYHECTGQVIGVLSSSYSHERKAWYITVLVRQDELIPGQSPGEEVWTDEDSAPVCTQCGGAPDNPQVNRRGRAGEWQLCREPIHGKYHIPEGAVQ